MSEYHYYSFKAALSGLKLAYSEQPNIKIHLAISVIVLLLAFFLNISIPDLVVLILTITIGLTVEFINTVTEALCDLVAVEWKKDIKIAKDLAAAMMLVVAVGSIIIGLLIFIPYIFKY